MCTHIVEDIFMLPLLPPLSLPHLSTLHRNQVEREERRALGQAGINIQDRVFTSEEVREGEVREGKGGREQGVILGRSNGLPPTLQDKLLCKHTNLDCRSQYSIFVLP